MKSNTMESCIAVVPEKKPTVEENRVSKLSQESISNIIKITLHPLKGMQAAQTLINTKSSPEFANHMKDYFTYSWANRQETPLQSKMNKPRAASRSQTETIKKSLNRYRNKVKIALPKRTNKAQKASSKEIQMWTYESSMNVVLTRNASSQTERPKSPKIKIIKDKSTNVQFRVKQVCKSTETNVDQATTMTENMNCYMSNNQWNSNIQFPPQAMNNPNCWYPDQCQYTMYNSKDSNRWANFPQHMYAMPTYSSKLKEVELGFKKIYTDMANKKSSRIGTGKDNKIIQPPFRPCARTPMRNYLGTKFKSNEEFKIYRSNLTLPTYKDFKRTDIYSRSTPCCTSIERSFCPSYFPNYHYMPSVIGHPVLCPGPSYY